MHCRRALCGALKDSHLSSIQQETPLAYRLRFALEAPQAAMVWPVVCVISQAVPRVTPFVLEFFCRFVSTENGAEAMEEGEGADEGEESDDDQHEQAEAAPAAQAALDRAEGANGAVPAAAAERSQDHTDRYQPPG